MNKYRVSRLHDYQENILEYHNLISVELNASADEVKAQGTTNLTEFSIVSVTSNFWTHAWSIKCS